MIPPNAPSDPQQRKREVISDPFLSGAVIALYGALVMPWIRAMRDRQAGVSGTIVVVVGIALVIMGIGLQRGWWG